MSLLIFAADPPHSPEGLNVEETISVALMRLHHGVRWNMYKGANPAAKESLYKILDNQKLKPYHEGVWRTLAHIGDSTTVELIEKQLMNNFSGDLGHYEQKAIFAMFESLGLMARRNVPGATELALRMADLNYWKNAKFKWPSVHGSENEILFHLHEGFALSGRNDLEGKRSELIASIKEPRWHEYAQWRMGRERLAPLRERVETEANQAISKEERASLTNYFNGDLQNPGPKKNIYTDETMPPKKD
ncbi:MAG: hypothetical protein HZA89_02385 [Verrucomicrobia bacterium]|nr:hypothetical protein [Verrucomicrobiota bacterium]